ncbi:BatA domain-containing protein [Luteimonas sp. Y-2-2-4F]|nr:BatA domain-containing protein [Luteimonas sp. Y-2-2-4F]MCD9032349.1 BatA domain-containing protein [Luteimonas sp. Y-2-2-4F]
MPMLLLPAGLLALAALLVPLLVHLARRQPTVPTPFAALRWLRQGLRPRARWRFDEWALLLLRLLLLAVMALWLAQPALRERAQAVRWSVVVPGADPSALPPPAPGETRRWLRPGWPALDTAPPDAAPAAVSSLLRQLDMELGAGIALQVWVPERVDGADAQRPRLSREVDWRIVPARDADGETVASAAPRLLVRHDDAHADALRYLRAAAAAWTEDAAEAGVAGIEVAVAATPLPPPAPGTALAWLVAGEAPAAVRDWVAAGGTALLAADVVWPDSAPALPAWRDADGTVLAHEARHGGGRMLQLTRPLRASEWPALADASFPDALRRQLLGPPPPPMRAPAAALAPERIELHWPQALRDLRGGLVWLLLALLAAERWLATSRRRSAAP